MVKRCQVSSCFDHDILEYTACVVVNTTILSEVMQIKVIYDVITAVFTIGHLNLKLLRLLYVRFISEANGTSLFMLI